MSIESAIANYPMARDLTHPFDPPAELLRYQREHPVRRVRIWDGSEPWLITRYDDARVALKDERLSADPQRPGYPEKSAAYAATLAHDVNMRTLDNPEHDVHKRMVVRDFTVKSVEGLRPKIQSLVGQLVERMLEGPQPADFFDAVAAPLPTVVICELMGVPYDDRDFFTERTAAVVSQGTSTEEAEKAGDELNAYFAELIDLRAADPRDDMISRAVHEQMSSGAIEREQLISLLRLILIAGHESTKNMVALGVLAVLQHPDVRKELAVTQDQMLIANAVDELLRYLGVLHLGRRRVAKEDLTIGGELIRTGEGVIVAHNVADRDESVFPNADLLDIRRPNARAYLSFGYGLHQCLGQLLARVELQAVHGTLWRRLPTLRLAVPFSELEFEEDATVFTVRSLPLKW